MFRIGHVHVADDVNDSSIGLFGETFVLAKLNSSIYRLKEALLIDAGNDEISLVNGFGTFGRGANADGREGVTNAGEE